VLLSPPNWNFKEDGVTVRARINGEPADRRLILEIRYRDSQDESKNRTMSVEFDNHEHVVGYKVFDRIAREEFQDPNQEKKPQQQKGSKQKKDFRQETKP
jgi:hypothetical protein